MKNVNTFLIFLVVGFVCAAMGLPVWGSVLVGAFLAWEYRSGIIGKLVGEEVSDEINVMLQRIYKANTSTGMDIDGLVDMVVVVRANRKYYTKQSFDIWLMYLENLVVLIEKSVITNSETEKVYEVIDIFLETTPDILKKIDTSNNILYKLRAFKADIKLNTRKDGK